MLIHDYLDEQRVEEENDVEDGGKDDSFGSVCCEGWLLWLGGHLRLRVILMLLLLLSEKNLLEFCGFLA